MCSSQNVKQAHHPAPAYCAPFCNGSRCTFRSQRRSAATCHNPSRSSNSQPCVAQLIRGAASAAPHRAAWRLASLQHALGLSRKMCPAPVPQSSVDRHATEYSEENEVRVHRWHAVFGCARSMPSCWCMRASTSMLAQQNCRRMSSAVRTLTAFRRTASFRSQSPPIPGESNRYRRFGCGVCRRHLRQEGLALNRPAVDGHRGEA